MLGLKIMAEPLGRRSVAGRDARVLRAERLQADTDISALVRLAEALEQAARARRVTPASGRESNVPTRC